MYINDFPNEIICFTHFISFILSWHRSRTQRRGELKNYKQANLIFILTTKSNSLAL